MKKNGFFIGIALVTTLLTACNKDTEDPALEVWKQQNEYAFNDLANDPSFSELSIPGGAGSIYYRAIQKGTGKRTFYNSRVEVYYKGWFVVTNEDIYFGTGIEAGTVFDQRLFDDGVPFKLAISAQVVDDNGEYSTVIEGWNIALQYMVVGDKWEIKMIKMI